MNSDNPQEIIRALINAGFSQTQIAEGTGITQPTISRILSGEHKDPKVSVLTALKEFAKKTLQPEKQNRRKDDPR